ncbi:hypothetical protein PQI07_31705 [Methylobacterium sp. 092160098-2]|uniref:MFS transporter n=1 Tax=Methylobacterium sp. 092160098-2 TaxID=3025129 RepID=UPI0023819F49|nr:hypothetical protein [Methylobacterium sp. 092160098-2]MDE4915177.1 hypothetical protein [Methylobacterium sp. 092160098-2]
MNLLFYAVLAWTAPMYQEAELTAARAGQILATFTAVFTIANPILGWQSKSHDCRLWLEASAGLAMLGLDILAVAPLSAPFLSIPLFAFGLGGTFMLGMALPMGNTDNSAEANAWNAFVQMIGYLIAAGGPLAVGRLRDAAGGFTLGFQCLTGVALLMVALSPFPEPRTSNASRAMAQA